MTYSARLVDSRLLAVFVVLAAALVACRSRRTEVRPAQTVSALVNELTTALATDSARASLTSDERDRLVAAIGVNTPNRAGVDGGTASFAIAEAIRRQSVAEGAHDRTVAERVLRTHYPHLMARKDTTPATLAVVLDEEGRLIRHAAGVGQQFIGDAATVLMRLGVDTLSARTKRIALQSFDDGRLHVITVTEGAGAARGAPVITGRVTEAQ